MDMEVEMEANSEQRKMSKKITKGGLITMPFIIGNITFPLLVKWVSLFFFAELM